MNVVDSSGWLEWFADGPGARHFARPLGDAATLVVPAITIFEVFRAVLRRRDESAALQAAAQMRQGRVVDLDDTLAMEAARLSIEHALPMADSIILATARSADAVLWTQDADFEGIAGVRFFPKPRPA